MGRHLVGLPAMVQSSFEVANGSGQSVATQTLSCERHPKLLQHTG